jgi:hypothetical protein
MKRVFSKRILFEEGVILPIKERMLSGEAIPILLIEKTLSAIPVS